MTLDRRIIDAAFLLGALGMLWSVAMGPTVLPLGASALIGGLAGGWIARRLGGADGASMETLAALVSCWAAAVYASHALPQRLPYLLVYTALAAGLAAGVRPGWPAAGAYLGAFLTVSAPPFAELHVLQTPGSLLLLALALRHGVRSRVGLPATARLPALLAGAFLGWSGLSSILGIYPYGSLRQWWVILSGAILAGLVLLLERSALERLRDLYCLLAAAGAACGLGAAGWRILHLGLAEGAGFRNFVFGRHPTYTTFWAVLALPLLGGSLIRGSRNRRILAGIGLLLCAGYLPFSYGRSSWLVAATYLLLALALAVRSLGRRGLVMGLAGLILAAVLGAALLPWMPSIWTDRVRSIGRLEESTRLTAWGNMLEIVRDQPILGPGLDSKRFLYPAIVGRQPYGIVTRQYLIEAHNTYLELASTVGLVGLALILAAAAGSLMPLLRGGSQEQAVLLLLAVGLGVDALFHYRLFTVDLGVLSWLAAALILRPPGAEPGPPIRQRWLRRSAVILAGLALAAGMRPGLAKSLVTRAVERGNAGQVEPAERLLQAARWLEPGNAHHRFIQAQVASYAGRTEPAQELMAEAVAMSPGNAFYHRESARIQLQAGRPQDARQSLETAIALEPYEISGAAPIQLGQVLWALGDRPGAIQQFTRALNLNPELVANPMWSQPEGRRLLRQVLASSIQDGRELWHRPDRRDEARLRLLRLAEGYRRSGLGPAAQEVLEWIIQQEPASEAAHLDLVRLHLEAGRIDQAAQVIDAGLARAPGLPAFHNARGRVRFAAGDLRGAAESFEEALRRWASISVANYVGHLHLARIYRTLGEEDAARREERKVRFLRSRIAGERADLEIHTGGQVSELRELGHVLDAHGTGGGVDGAGSDR